MADPEQREQESQAEPDTKYHLRREEEEAERAEDAARVGEPPQPRDDD